MASKGKGKDKVKSSPPPVETEAPTEKDIVPGKLSEKRWLSVLNRAEGTEIATGIVSEVFEVAFSIIYSQYLEKQSFPHTICDAKYSLLRIIEWQFLARDEGESNTRNDPSWVEDEEPIPATIDSWARGVVPSQSLSTLDSAIESLDPVRVHSSLTEVSDVGSEVTDIPESDLRGSTVGSTRKFAPKKKTQSRPRPVAHRSKARLVPIRPPSPDPPADPHADLSMEAETVSSLRSHTPSSLTASTPHPLPYGMKPIQLTWQKEVSYDKRGKIVDMVKLDPTRFPSHRVKPVVTLVKPPPYQPSNKTSRRFAAKSKQPPSHAHKLGAGELSKRGATNKLRAEHQGTRGNRRFPELPALPALVDTIDPVAGVTVSEAGRTVHGPKPHAALITGQTHQAKLQSLQPAPPRTSDVYSVGGNNNSVVENSRAVCVDVQ